MLAHRQLVHSTCRMFNALTTSCFAVAPARLMLDGLQSVQSMPVTAVRFNGNVALVPAAAFQQRLSCLWLCSALLLAALAFCLPAWCLPPVHN